MRGPRRLRADRADGAGTTARATPAKRFAVIGAACAERGLAQPRRLFEHRVEHRREVAGRGIDDPQHLGGRGLLLQRLARLGDQPRVLHRDDRLRREVLQQRDLLVGERPHFLAIDRDGAEQRVVLAQRRPARAVRAPPSSTSARRSGSPARYGSSSPYRRCGRTARRASAGPSAAAGAGRSGLARRNSA